MARPPIGGAEPGSLLIIGATDDLDEVEIGDRNLTQAPRESLKDDFKNGLLDAFIPRLVDQDRWAQLRCPMEMIRQGWPTSLFHASQQVDDIAIGLEDPVQEAVVAQELPDVFLRIELRTFRRQWIRVMLGGTIRRPAGLIDEKRRVSARRDLIG